MAKNPAFDKLKKDIKLSKKLEKPRVRGIVESIIGISMAEKGFSDTDIEAALKRYADLDMEWNEVRTSRTSHLMEKMNADDSEYEAIDAALKALKAIHYRFGNVSVTLFEEKSDADIRKGLDKLLSKDKDGASLVMIEALEKVVVPVTTAMFQMCKEKYQIIASNGNRRQLQRELTELVPEKEIWSFYLTVDALAQKYVIKKAADDEAAKEAAKELAKKEAQK